MTSGRSQGEVLPSLQYPKGVEKGAAYGYLSTELRAIHFSSGQDIATTQQACENLKEPNSYQVPSLGGLSPFQANSSATGSLDEGSMQCGLAMQTAFSNGNEVVSDARLEQMLDAQVPDVDMDSRKGSPCRQAAADFMEPVGVDFPAPRAHSASSPGLPSAISQTLAEGFMPSDAHPPPQHLPSPFAVQGHAEPAGDEQPAPIPGLAQQPDWFNAMMEQAQSVGLWGGVKTESREVPDRDCSLPSGPPILPQHLLSRAASCVEEKVPEDENPLAVYEMGIASMLSSHQGSSNLPTAQDSNAHPPPRLQPVSLGMPGSHPLAALSAARPFHEPSFQQPNDGPFRPPTKPRTLPMAPPSRTEMLHPMLYQSKLQISLGLAADKPLDLKSWGYGGDIAHANANRLDAAHSGDGKALSAPAAPGARLLGPLSVTQAASECINPDSGPVSPSAGQTPALKAPSHSAAVPCTSASTFSSMMDAQTTDHKSTSMSTGLEDPSSRAESLERYREKKRRRLFSKTIRYHKRKVNADKRPRIKGRFVKASGAEASGLGDDEAMASEGPEEEEVEMA